MCVASSGVRAIRAEKYMLRTPRISLGKWVAEARGNVSNSVAAAPRRAGSRAALKGPQTAQLAPVRALLHLVALRRELEPNVAGAGARLEQGVHVARKAAH
jgi:hypothetical protein